MRFDFARAAGFKGKSEIQAAHLSGAKCDGPAEQFLHTVSHELRTPLAVIRANAAHQQPAKTAHSLTVIESETARMGNLVDALLLLSAGESARQ